MSNGGIVVESGSAHVALVGGRVAVVRSASLRDAPGVRALHLACLPATLRDRYLGPPPRLTPSMMATLLHPLQGCAIVACAGRGDGEVLGMAQVSGGRPVAEIAVLVRDDHQRRGLGTILARRAIDAAAALGFQDMVAYGVAGNPRLGPLLRRLGLRSQLRYDGPVVTMRASLGSHVDTSARASLRIVQ